MATLRLFGADITVDTAITTVQPVPGLSITTQLINSATSIRIKLDGALGAAKFGAFTTTPRCSLAGNIVQLAAGSTVPNAGQVTINVFGTPSAFSAPVTVIADPKSGTGFTLQSKFSLKQYLNIDLGELTDLAGIDSPDSWLSSQLVLSIPRRESRLDVNDSGPALVIRDGFGVGPWYHFAAQSARLVHMRVEPAAVLPVYRIEKNGLHLHADMLDPTSNIDDANGLMFQHVVSEAQIVANVTQQGGNAKASSWTVEPQQDGGSYVLTISSLKDEHGHPLMLESKTPLPLAGRSGTAIPSQDGKSNSAIVLGRADQEMRIQVKVVAADPVALFDRKRGLSALDSSYYIQPPYWMNADGTVSRRANRPREVLGLSSNVTLATGTDRSVMDAYLVLSPLSDPAAGLRFIMSHLEFRADASMQMSIDTAEMAIHAINDTGMQRRAAKGIDNRAVRLPLLNSNWAFADLAGPRQNGDGAIATQGRLWMDAVDVGLHHPASGAFPYATIPDYAHVEGMRAQPVAQPFTRVVASPIVTTMKGDARDTATLNLKNSRLAQPAATALPFTALTHVALAGAPMLAAFTSPAALAAPLKVTTDFLFAGDPDFSQASSDARKENVDARKDLGYPADLFFKFWAGVLPPQGGAAPDRWAAARRALRQYLVGTQDALPDPDDWELDDLIEASGRLTAARTVMASNPPSVLGFETWTDTLDDAFPEDVPELLDPENGDGIIELIFQFAFAPPSMALLRRAADLILRNPAFQYRDILGTLVSGIDALLQLPPSLNGLLAELLQGTNAAFDAIEKIWTASRQGMEQELKDLLDGLVNHYGPVFNMDVFHAILGDSADSEALLHVLGILGYPLGRLADLAGDPPDYLLVTRRFRRPSGSSSDETTNLNPIDKAAALWGRRFDFCSLGAGHFWDFVLDDQATMIVKLGGSRGLDAILKEVQSGATAPGRPDPIGVIVADEDADTALDNFIDLLPSDLKASDWRGILVVNPTIDLNRDPILSTLCGFPAIAGRFAAIGGRAANLQDVQLNVWGRIEKHADPSGWVDNSGATAGTPKWGQCDVGWTLTKFEATIKNTTILSGEIAFLLDIRELFGKKTNIGPITVVGTLPPARDASSPRDFTFSATFDQPKVIDIDVKFIKALRLRGIKVGTFHNDTVLNVDADLICQQADFGFFKFEPQGDPVRLSDVRIGIPSLPPGRALAMGLQRYLNFDLGAISFPLPPDKQLQVAGLEIKPTSIGLLRDTAPEILDRLHKETIGLKDPGFPPAPAGTRFAYPYLDTQIEFGNKPSVGGGGRLAIVARVGTPVGENQLGTPGLGLASLTGRELSISLFHLLTFEAATVDARVSKVIDPDSGADRGSAGTILLDKFNLKIGSWSLFNDTDVRTLILAHDVNTESKGVLGFFAHDPGGGFFKLHWLLLAKGIDPGRNLKNKLLESDNDDLDAERNLILSILSGMGSATPQIKARLDDSPWLFGAKFELGPLFSPCTFVFQDGSYYGIKLGGPLAKLLTGDDKGISFAYIPGPDPSLDRFRTTFHVAAFDAIASMRSGEIALEWSPNWDFLIDCGQPWRGPGGYAWDRAFSMPVGIYEAKFGFFVEKRTTPVSPTGNQAVPGQLVTFSAGAGFYLGYSFQWVAGPAWVRAGIGIFGVMIGSATLQLAGPSSNPLALLKGTLVRLEVTGVIGIYAYGEGGVDIWILSARFRVSAQAFLEVSLIYIPHGRSQLAYSAMLAAAYSASVRVGCGWFSWTFSVSGSVQMEIKGQVSFG